MKTRGINEKKQKTHTHFQGRKKYKVFDTNVQDFFSS